MSWLSSLYPGSRRRAGARGRAAARGYGHRVRPATCGLQPDGAVTGKLPARDQVALLAEEGDWLKVRAPQGEGYVSARFVDLRCRRKGCRPRRPAFRRRRSQADLQDPRRLRFTAPAGCGSGPSSRRGCSTEARRRSPHSVAAEAARFPGGAASLLRVLAPSPATRASSRRSTPGTTASSASALCSGLPAPRPPRRASGPARPPRSASSLIRSRATSPVTASTARASRPARARSDPASWRSAANAWDADAKAVLRQPIWAYRFWRRRTTPAGAPLPGRARHGAGRRLVPPAEASISAAVRSATTSAQSTGWRCCSTSTSTGPAMCPGRWVQHFASSRAAAACRTRPAGPTRTRPSCSTSTWRLGTGTSMTDSEARADRHQPSRGRWSALPAARLLQVHDPGAAGAGGRDRTSDNGGVSAALYR